MGLSLQKIFSSLWTRMFPRSGCGSPLSFERVVRERVRRHAGFRGGLYWAQFPATVSREVKAHMGGQRGIGRQVYSQDRLAIKNMAASLL